MQNAHVKRLPDGTWAEPHTLEAHLNGTSELAATFAKKFDSEKWGKIIGLGHDTGKSPAKWQEYLCGKSGFSFDENSHTEGILGRLDHSSPSAKLVEEIFGRGIGRILSYCIAGHHAGLPDWDPDDAGVHNSLKLRLSTADTNGIPDYYKNIFKDEQGLKLPRRFDYKTIDLALWIRMLFSCLVDADFLDTEKYMEDEKANLRSGYLEMKELLARFNNYMEQKMLNSQKTTVNNIRQNILTDCRSAAINNRPGIFSLNVPTGGGKTLSSMAFALEHAVKYGFERVIYVIPYTSIIEQNADVFREALGADQVVEHHSNIGEDESTVKSRLSAENWDAPIIVTTSVQFFESLFASKSTRCRKLHNIINSVVVIDEAQLVPVDFLLPILQVLKLLYTKYHVTFVISTATQPAFEEHDNFKGFPKGDIQEIIKDVPKLFKILNRVKIDYPSDWQPPATWEIIAERIKHIDRVLCVVSDRKSCRELYKLLPVGTYHLSALMCGQHRSDTITEIKKRLLGGGKVQVISTQLVEAGVDLDFPVVYRALAGLDSIAQAAGRCNREGNLSEPGKVVIFVPPKKAPPGILRKASETTETILKAGLEDPLVHSNFRAFFSELYWKANSLDKNEIIRLLTPDPVECAIQFRTAAMKFNIIDETLQRSIIVPYGGGEEYIEELKKTGPQRYLLRKLQRYTVNIYSRDFSIMSKQSSIEEIFPGIYILVSNVEYDKNTGLLIDEIPDNPELFIL